MKVMHRWVLLILMACATAARGQNISLDAPRKEKLKQIVASDPEATSYFQEILKGADASLKDKPNPIPVIQSEHLLANDPKKVRTRESLHDIPKMTMLAYAYIITGKPAYLQKATEFLLAWAAVNHSAGDPIDDTKLEGAIVAYDLIRPDISSEDRHRIEQWLRQLGEAEANSKNSVLHIYNNFNSHRLKIVGLIGFLLNDRKLIDTAVEGYKTMIAVNLNSDGSSSDFRKRDALHYHIYDIEPLLSLARAAQMNGVDLYSYTTQGASLSKSVAFLFPFCEGKQTHNEFVNSTARFDKMRANNGEKEYQAGHLWEPKNAKGVLTLYAYFDKEKSYSMLRTIGLTFTNYPNWDGLVEEVQKMK